MFSVEAMADSVQSRLFVRPPQTPLFAPNPPAPPGRDTLLEGFDLAEFPAMLGSKRTMDRGGKARIT